MRDGKADVERLDLSPIMDALIGRLDAWVEKNEAPPPSRSDWDYLRVERLALAPGMPSGIAKSRWLGMADAGGKRGAGSDGDNSGRFERCRRTARNCVPSRRLPRLPAERGCPWCGHHVICAIRRAESEPIDGRGVLVDMNSNGSRDGRETVTQAWRRLGLLKSDEGFNRSKYVECVRAAVSGLKSDGLVTEKAANAYIEQTSKLPLPAQ
jgi:hypothetical protein